jgi:hypothetical protein
VEVVFVDAPSVLPMEAGEELAMRTWWHHGLGWDQGPRVQDTESQVSGFTSRPRSLLFML